MAFRDEMLMDVFAWLLNVSTSVLIVFINKLLMHYNGFGFSFAITLSALHFLSCALGIWVSQLCSSTRPAEVPLRDILWFAVIGSFSIGSANISLLVNSVGFYQISKLMIVPFVCMVEMFYLGKAFAPPVLASIAVVVVGVAIVTVSDVAVKTLGLVIAMIFVASSGMQQIVCGSLQRKHNITSNQLLSKLAPIQGTMLLLAGPFVDQLVTQQWVTTWDASMGGLSCLLLSCAVAVVVNISQYLCLGRFSATSFQVLGHAKTVLVLLGGWLLFGDIITTKQLSGESLLITGAQPCIILLLRGDDRRAGARVAP